MAIVNTGLGWEADSNYLVYTADTFIGRVNNRYFYKRYDGYAVGVLLKDLTTGWCGPYLLSTVSENAHFYITGIGAFGPDNVAQYQRRTWYCNSNYWFITDDYTLGALPYLEITRTANDPSAPIQVLRAAGVRPCISQRGMSFAAGLAAGLAVREWAYMGVENPVEWGTLKVARFYFYKYKMSAGSPPPFYQLKYEILQGDVYGFYTDSAGLYYNIKLLSKNDFVIKGTLYNLDGSVQSETIHNVTQPDNAWRVFYITNIPQYEPMNNIPPALPREPNDNLNASPPIEVLNS